MQATAMPVDVLEQAEVLGYHNNQPVYWLDGMVFTKQDGATDQWFYRVPFSGSIVSLNRISDQFVYFDQMYNCAYCSTKCRDEQTLTASANIKIVPKTELRTIWFGERQGKCAMCDGVLYKVQEDRYNLHKMDGITDVPYDTLPIVFTGTSDECHAYTAKLGYEYKIDGSIFGGYFPHSRTRTCLVVTAAN